MKTMFFLMMISMQVFSADVTVGDFYTFKYEIEPTGLDEFHVEYALVDQPRNFMRLKQTATFKNGSKVDKERSGSLTTSLGKIALRQMSNCKATTSNDSAVYQVEKMSFPFGEIDVCHERSVIVKNNEQITRDLYYADVPGSKVMHVETKNNQVVLKYKMIDFKKQ
jgi:hypothetical protein